LPVTALPLGAGWRKLPIRKGWGRYLILRVVETSFLGVCCGKRSHRRHSIRFLDLRQLYAGTYRLSSESFTYKWLTWQDSPKRALPQERVIMQGALLINGTHSVNFITFPPSSSNMNVVADYCSIRSVSSLRPLLRRTPARRQPTFGRPLLLIGLNVLKNSFPIMVNGYVNHAH